MVDVVKYAQTPSPDSRLQGWEGLSPPRDYSKVKAAPSAPSSALDNLEFGTRGIRSSISTSATSLLSKVSTPAGIKSTVASVGGLAVSGTVGKVSGMLSSATGSALGGISGLFGGGGGGEGGGGAGADTAAGAASDYGISREAWDVRSGKTVTPIAFNINPSSVDFSFQGRGSSALTSTGRIFDRFNVDANQGQMVFDVSFQMQTGSLLSPEMKAASGHKVLFGLMEMLNESLRLEDGSVNLQVLRINTVRFGYMELTGMFSMDSGLIISEAADDPFKGDYAMVFQVVRSSPPITLAASLQQSVESGGYE